MAQWRIQDSVEGVSDCANARNFLQATPTFTKPRPSQAISNMKMANLTVYQSVFSPKLFNKV
jgi:hypothetical protein